jgi:hypothetical protein
MAAALALIGTIVTAAIAVIGLVLGLFNLREKVWPKPTGPHPLEAGMRDIAAAVRELADARSR